MYEEKSTDLFFNFDYLKALITILSETLSESVDNINVEYFLENVFDRINSFGFYSSMWLFIKNKGRSKLKWYKGINPEDLIIPENSKVLSKIYELGQTIFVKDLNAFCIQKESDENILSTGALFVPIKMEDETKGILGIQYLTRSKVSVLELHFFNIVSSIVSILLKLDVEKKISKRFKDLLYLAGLETLIEKVVDGIIILDKNFKMTILSSKDSSFLPDFSEFEKGELLNSIYQMEEEEFLKLKEGITNFIEKEIIIKGLEEKKVKISATSIKNESDEFEKIVVLIRDVTREEIEMKKKYIDARIGTLENLMAGLTHERNNPITAIIGFSQMLKLKFKENSEMIKILEKIEREAERTSKIIKRIEIFTFQKSSIKQLVNISEIIDEILNEKFSELEKKNIKVLKIFEKELPFLEIERENMKLAFMNIIENSIENMYEEKNGGILTITLKNMGQFLMLSFKDTGSGIPPENIGKIFDPFFTTKEVGKGMGLGLSITYSIVKKHNGKIYAESTPGEGTEIIIELPIYVEQENIYSQSN